MSRQEPVEHDVGDRGAQLVARYLDAIDRWNGQLNELDIGHREDPPIKPAEIAATATEMRDELSRSAGDLLMTVVVSDTMSALENIIARARSTS